MNSMPVEDHNPPPHIHPHQPPPPLPPYTAVDHQAVCRTDQPSLPSPVLNQPTQALVGKITGFQRYRQSTICLSCRQEIVTKTEYRISGGTWFMCCVVFFVGGFGCCFIPFLLKSCKDVVHRCPECNVVLGRKPLM